MDIATRLKEFLDYSSLQSTQFADACGIPRPSFSQLLRGRNRKVSDEVIAKIHDAFPNLSVLWLMFGEGDMVTGANIEISEPQNGANPPLHSTEPANSEQVGNGVDDNLFVRDFRQTTSAPALPGMNTADFVPAPLPFAPMPAAQPLHQPVPPPDAGVKAMPTSEPRREIPAAGFDAPTVAPAADAPPTPQPDTPTRRVVSIMVFYSDRSFETFVPEAAT